VVVSKDTLELDDLPPELRGAPGSPGPAGRSLKDLARGSAEVTKKSAILDALRDHEGNVTRTAKRWESAALPSRTRCSNTAFGAPARNWPDQPT
jgi:transcriptional regulator of acetoin/glycerol metabolism